MKAEDILTQFKEWLAAEQSALIAQHTKLGEDRLIMQGRYEASQIVVNKLAELIIAPASEEVSEPADS